MYTYRQKAKQVARHTMLKRAVELLTIERNAACCVRRTYVRDLLDYYSDLDESNEKREAEKIDFSYIRMWENIHSQSIRAKRVDELTVCYLSGPEPENDFNELTSLGVLPYNIWAFECEKATYTQALQSIDSTDFFQPKLIRTSIERFFENTPKVFDIVYIDACSPLISEQHALRCISSMFKNHRLASPGILISNFAEVDSTNKADLNEYLDLLTKFNIAKKYSDSSVIEDNGVIKFKNYYDEEYQYVNENFEQCYGDFVTAMICNAGSITIPTLRFANSTFLSIISNNSPIENFIYKCQDINTIHNNTFYKFIALNKFLEQNNACDEGIPRTNKLISELSASWNGFSLISCFRKIYNIKEMKIDVNPKLVDTLNFFENSRNMYQFLDRTTGRLFFDTVINQLSCPMHYCSDKVKRLTYTAKETRMFMDLIMFDECRYIYDWLPAIDQIQNAFSNNSWQYVFRFALDGLVKQRMNYNNEYYFQGSVVHQGVEMFGAATIDKRIKIN